MNLLPRFFAARDVARIAPGTMLALAALVGSLTIGLTAGLSAASPAPTPLPPCSTTSALDDGSADVAFYGGLNLDVLWLNRFLVEAGGTQVIAAEVCWLGWTSSAVFLPDGHPFTILVLSDPDGDGDPADAEVLAQTSSNVIAGSPNSFQRIDLSTTSPGAPGSLFFVAALATTPATPPNPPAYIGEPPAWYPSIADTSAGDGRASWLSLAAGGSGGLGQLSSLTNLADAGYGEAFMIRAVTTSSLVGDLDCDGVIGGADLGILLAGWGPCTDCAADLDGDGIVDGSDLGVLLGAWG